MKEDRDLDPLIDPGRLLRAATRRAEVRTAARVDARLLAAPRDADAESVTVGIANVCVAVGWVRRARWGAIPIADDELSKAPWKILRLTPTLGRIWYTVITGKLGRERVVIGVSEPYRQTVRRPRKPNRGSQDVRSEKYKNEKAQLLRTRTVLTVRLSKWRTTATTTTRRPCSWCVPPHVPTLSTHRSRALPFFAPVKVQTRLARFQTAPSATLTNLLLLRPVSAVGLRRGRPARPTRRARLPQQVRPRLARADPDDRHPPTRRDGRIAHG